MAFSFRNRFGAGVVVRPFDRHFLRYLRYLWPLPALLLMGQAVMWLNGNAEVIGVRWWISAIDLVMLLLCFGAAAGWSFALLQPALGGVAGGLAEPVSSELVSPELRRLERLVAAFPSRALRAFGVAGGIYALYLAAVTSSVALLGQHLFSWPLFVTLLLNFGFASGVLAVALALAGSIAFSVHLRCQLFRRGLFSGDLHAATDSYPTISIARRPWLVFLVTGFLPTLILVLYVALSKITSGAEASFILAQSVVFLCVSGVGSVLLIWRISRILKQVSREMHQGLRQLASGIFDHRVPVLLDGEFGEMARGLNMALAGLQERESLKDSLAIAADIQQGLLPKSTPTISGYQLHGLQQSCYSVGGDYYDHLLLEDGYLWLVVADVSGKGYPAALTMANLQAMLKGLAKVNWPIEQAVGYLNEALCDSLTGGRFVTLILAKLQPQSNRVVWLNAGHVPAMVVTADGVTPLEASGPPLGLVRDANYAVAKTTMNPGDLLLLYSDGVIDRRGAAGGERFGDRRLRQWLQANRHLDAARVNRALLDELEAFGGDQRDDDLTLLCLRRDDGEQETKGEAR